MNIYIYDVYTEVGGGEVLKLVTCLRILLLKTIVHFADVGLGDWQN